MRAISFDHFVNRGAPTRRERAGDTPHPYGLLVEPYVGQVLVEVMAWADFPTLHVGAQRNDAVPVRYHHRVRLGVEHALLERTHERALLCGVSLAQHLT